VERHQAVVVVEARGLSGVEEQQQERLVVVVVFLAYL
jgi:hypothetical protein